MTDPGFDDLVEYLDRPRTEGAAEWQRRRAGRRSITENDPRMGYESIVFPSPAALRHAALVVCSHMVAEPDPVAAAREILEALALPLIMRDGGDGRAMKSRGRVTKINREPLPIGFDPEDFGRPDAKVSRKKKGDSAEVLRDGL